MTNRHEQPTPRENLLVVAMLVIFCILVILCATGCCTTKVVEHIIHQRDTTYIERQKVDSVYKRDSIYIREKGDTVYIYKEKIRDRYRYIHDTIRLVKVDSVFIDRPVEVEKEKPLTWWQTARLEAFWWLAGAVVLLLAWVFRKSILKLLTI